ncbi:MAG: hypothetical protein ACKVUS_05625 [Saprospiraceae bacterium]
MFSSIIFHAIMGICGNEPRFIHIHKNPGVPPPPGDPWPIVLIAGGPRPEPWHFVLIAIAAVGGIAGGYLSQQFLDPSLAISGLSAFASGRIFTRASFAFLNPQPLPPKATKQ